MHNIHTIRCMDVHMQVCTFSVCTYIHVCSITVLCFTGNCIYMHVHTFVYSVDHQLLSVYTYIHVCGVRIVICTVGFGLCPLLHLHIQCRVIAVYSVMNFELVQIEQWEDSEDFLEQLARRTGRLLKVQRTAAVMYRLRVCVQFTLLGQSCKCIIIFMHVYMYMYGVCGVHHLEKYWQELPTLRDAWQSQKQLLC